MFRLALVLGLLAGLLAVSPARTVAQEKKGAPKEWKVPPVHTTGAPLALALTKNEIDLDRLLSLAPDILDEAAGTQDLEAQDALLASLVPLGGKGTKLLETYSGELNERIVRLARSADIDPAAFKKGAALQRFQGLVGSYGSLLGLADRPAGVLMKDGVENHQRLKKYLARYGIEDRSFLLGESALLLSRAAQTQKQGDKAEAYASEALATFQRSKFTAHEPTARAFLELARVARDRKEADNAKRYTDAARDHLSALLNFREDLLGKDHPLSRGLRPRVAELGGGRGSPAGGMKAEPKKEPGEAEPGEAEPKRKALPGGDADALFKRGVALEKTDPKASAALYEKAARAGHGHAQMYYGLLLYDGDVIPRNRQEAIVWLRKAAANPNLPQNLVPVAEFNLKRVSEDRD